MWMSVGKGRGYSPQRLASCTRPTRRGHTMRPAPSCRCRRGRRSTGRRHTMRPYTPVCHEPAGAPLSKGQVS